MAIIAWLHGERFVHQASATKAQTSTAEAATNERLNALWVPVDFDCARFHTPTKLGTACSSASLTSLNSARILFSSPINSISTFRLSQRFAQTFLAAVVMLTRTSDRDTHHLGGFAQAEVLVKHEV